MQKENITSTHIDCSELGTLVDSLAKSVHQRGFSVPAIFILEMYKPLTTVAHNGALLVAPLLIPLFGKGFYKSAQIILESKDNLELLITRIEDCANGN